MFEERSSSSGLLHGSFWDGFRYLLNVGFPASVIVVGEATCPNTGLHGLCGHQRRRGRHADSLVGGLGEYDLVISGDSF